MAVPREVEVLIYGVDEFGSSDITSQNENVRTIVLFSGVNDVARAWTAGFRFKTLNIGNLYSENCKLQCSMSVCLANEDIDDIRFLLDSGVTGWS